MKKIATVVAVSASLVVTGCGASQPAPAQPAPAPSPSAWEAGYNTALSGEFVNGCQDALAGAGIYAWPGQQDLSQYDAGYIAACQEMAGASKNA